MHRRQFGFRQLAQLRVVGFEHRPMLFDLAEHLAVLTGRADHVVELRALTRKLGVLAIIGDNRGVAQTTFELGEACFDSLELVEHRVQRASPRGEAAASRVVRRRGLLS